MDSVSPWGGYSTLDSVDIDCFKQILELLHWSSIASLAAIGNKSIIAKVANSVKCATLDSTLLCAAAYASSRDTCNLATGTAVIFRNLPGAKLDELKLKYDRSLRRCSTQLHPKVASSMCGLEARKLTILGLTGSTSWSTIAFWSRFIKGVSCLDIDLQSSDIPEDNCLPASITKLHSRGHCSVSGLLLSRLLGVREFSCDGQASLNHLVTSNLTSFQGGLACPPHYSTLGKQPLQCPLVRLVAPYALLPATICPTVFPPTLELLYMRFQSLLDLDAYIAVLPRCKFVHAHYDGYELVLPPPRRLFPPPSLAVNALAVNALAADTLAENAPVENALATDTLAEQRILFHETQTSLYPRLFYYLLQDSFGYNRFEIRRHSCPQPPSPLRHIVVCPKPSQLQQLFSTTIRSIHYVESTPSGARLGEDLEPFGFVPGLFDWEWLSVCCSLRELALHLNITSVRSYRAGWMKLLSTSCPKLEILDIKDYPILLSGFSLPASLLTLRSRDSTFLMSSSHRLPPNLTDLDVLWSFETAVQLPASLTAFQFGFVPDKVLYSVLKNGTLKKPVSLLRDEQCKLTITGFVAPPRIPSIPVLLSDIVLDSLRVLQQTHVGAVIGIDTLLSELQPTHANCYKRLIQGILRLEAVPDGVNHLILNYTSLLAIDLPRISVDTLDLTQWADFTHLKLPPTLTHLVCSLISLHMRHGDLPPTITRLSLPSLEWHSQHDLLRIPKTVTSLSFPLHQLLPAARFPHPESICEFINSSPGDPIPECVCSRLSDFPNLERVCLKNSTILLPPGFVLKLPRALKRLSIKAIVEYLTQKWPFITRVSGNYTMMTADGTAITFLTFTRKSSSCITSKALFDAIRYTGPFKIVVCPRK